MKPYDRNIPYNDLPELSPPEEKVITIEILHALNRANKALAELKGLAKKLPNQAMLVNTITLREAKASTDIENIFPFRILFKTDLTNLPRMPLSKFQHTIGNL